MPRAIPRAAGRAPGGQCAPLGGVIAKAKDRAVGAPLRIAGGERRKGPSNEHHKHRPRGLWRGWARSSRGFARARRGLRSPPGPEAGRPAHRDALQNHAAQAGVVAVGCEAHCARCDCIISPSPRHHAGRGAGGGAAHPPRHRKFRTSTPHRPAPSSPSGGAHRGRGAHYVEAG